MILSLGDFAFNLRESESPADSENGGTAGSSKLAAGASMISSVNRSIDSCITFKERISNHAAALVCKKWEETISIEGETLPGGGSGQKALNPLIDIIKEQKPNPLTSGTGEFFGCFVVVSFKEGRQAFFSTGEFLKQNFTIELKRVNDGEYEKL